MQTSLRGQSMSSRFREVAPGARPWLSLPADIEVASGLRRNAQVAPITAAVTLLAALGSPVFFAVAAAAGYTYAGSESSAVYVAYSLSVALLALTVCVVGMVLYRQKYPMAAWIAGVFPLLIGVAYFAVSNGGAAGSSAWPLFRNFLVWAVPAFYIGLHTGAARGWRQTTKLLDPLMVIFSVASVSSVVAFAVGEVAAKGIGGATYQTLSYTSALAFGLNIHLLLDHGSVRRYGIANHKIYRLICIALLPVQVFAAVVSGGRGGVVLIGVYLLQVLVQQRTAGSRLRSASVVALAAVLSLALLQLSMPNTAVSQGYERSFAYVSASGIDWSGTSGRDAVYTRALALIGQRPGLGYGPFGFVHEMAPYVYPHNLFLELLLGGGAVGLMLGVAVLGALSVRFFRLKLQDNSLGSLGVLVTYQVVMLMFSGSYLGAPTLWFTAGLITAAGRPRLRVVDSEASLRRDIGMAGAKKDNLAASHR